MATIIKRSHGWQAYIRKKGFKPLTRTFKRKADAEVWAGQIESEMSRNVFVDRTTAETMTLGELLLRYKGEVSILKKSCGAETSRISTFLRHPLASRCLATLKTADFSSYRDERLKNVSGTTVIKELNLMSLIFDTARREWCIHVENPVKLIRRPKANRARDRRLLEREEERLLAATESPMLGHVIRFALETAMRRGEITKMKWAHIDLRKRVLLVPETKTDTPRLVPLSSRAIAVLNALPRRIDGVVFGMRPDSVTQAFERACERAGIKDLRFHDLRHEAASRLFERGLNPMQVAAITGHKTLEMLKRYTHLRAEDLARLLS